MKNLLIYISPAMSFNNPHVGVVNDALALVKVQIDNSLELGWKPKDILLYTNFDFKYGAIKAKVLEDVEFLEFCPPATKINAIVKLFDLGLIKNELYWFHDLDAFQLMPITEDELDLEKADIGITTWTIYKKMSAGSVFFKSTAGDIFPQVVRIVHEKHVDEEKALDSLLTEDAGIRKRIKTIDRTYNFAAFDLVSNYGQVMKPIRVAHFHPSSPNKLPPIQKPLDYFKGNNSLHIQLIPDRLIKIFRYHRIR